MIVLLGKNGSGKTYTANKLYELGYYRSVNYTTRKPRNMEVDGLDYHFVSDNEFLQLVKSGFFAEYKERSGNYYGTPITNLKENAILVAGDTEKISRFCDDRIIPIYIDVDIETRFKKVVLRGTDSNELFARFHNENFSYLNDFSAIFIDNNYETSVQQIINILRKPVYKQFELLTSVQEFYSQKINDFDFCIDGNQMLMFLKYEEYILRMLKLSCKLYEQNEQQLNNLYLKKIQEFLEQANIEYNFNNDSFDVFLDAQMYKVKNNFTKVLERGKRK